MILTTTLQANQAQEYTERADFFRLLESTGPVEVRFYSNGAEVARAEDVGEGYAEKFDAGEFDKIRISATVNTTVHFVTRLGNVVQYDKPPTGDVTVAGTVQIGNLPTVRGAFTQTQVTVTNAATQLRPANANRRYLLIQNKDTVGQILVRVDGVNTGVVTNGVMIEPGGSWELQGYVPTAAVFAFGSIASNANIIVVEG